MPFTQKPLTAQQEKFIRLSAQGKSRPELMMELFGIDVHDPEQIMAVRAADAKMTRWRKRPEFETVWKDEVRNVLYGCTSEAIQVIRKQMKSEDQPWLQNKAANDVLNYGKSQIYGDEEKTVNVKIEGMPEIGSPDKAE